MKKLFSLLAIALLLCIGPDSVFAQNYEALSWGRNQYGELGRVTNQDLNQVDNSSWAQVSGGSYHTLAIKTDGSLWSWGYNASGQLGNGTNNQSTIPVQIGSATDWVMVAAGSYFSVALKSDGTLWSWGANNLGQLGHGNNTSSNVPVQIGSGTTWSSISAGYYHVLATRTDGSLWSWGSNNYGQLGDGTNSSSNNPSQVGSSTDWGKVSAGNYHSIATRSDGTLWTWGYNYYGQLGNGANSNSTVPAQVGSSTDWELPEGLAFSSLVKKSDGTLWSWGYNTFGQLGIGSNSNSNSPAQIGSASNWSSFSGGNYHVLAVKTDGTLWAWGYNSDGQLGTGNTANQNAPVQVGSSTNWTSVSAGSFHSMAINSSNLLFGWGENNYGQTGNDEESYPFPISSANWKTIASGGYHTLGIKNDGSLWAWGDNFDGQLGNGTTNNSFTPIQIGSATDWVSISCSNYSSYAIKSDGSLWSWGYNSLGQLGIGNNSSAYTPTQVGSSTDWTSVSSKSYHVLATRSDGTLWSWGYNYYGQLGDGSNSNSNSPSQIGSSTNWKSISTGFYHSAAVQNDGTLWSWGSNSSGQLGNGSTVHSNTPAQVGTSSSWGSLTCGSYYTMAIQTDGTLWAWGQNYFGELGNGTTYNAYTPTQSGSASNWTSVSAGIYHTLATQSDSSLWSWGYNFYGQLGNGNHVNSADPIQIGTDYNWATPSAGLYHSVGLASSKGPPPVAVCKNVTVSAGSNCNANASIDDGSYDPENLSITLSQNPSGPYPLGTTNVTLTVTNSKNSSRSCTATVTVVDDTKPTIQCAAGASASAAAGTCFADVTVQGPEATDNCMINNALDFDGGDDYFDGYNSNLPTGTDPFTVEAWIKPRTGQNGTIFDWGTFNNNTRSSLLYINQRIYFSGQWNDRIGATTLTPGSWYHLAITYDGTYMKLYVNGSLDGSSTINLGTTGSYFKVGRGINSGGQEPFDGTIDEIRVWNTARSQSDIQNTMNAIVSAQSTLVAYFNFDQGTAGGTNTSITQALDASGNAGHGAITNMSLSGSSSNFVSGAPALSGTGITLVNDFNNTDNASGTYPVGSTVVTWTATDGHNNSSICTQTIVVTDDELPSAICKDATLTIENGIATLAGEDLDNGSSDNCGILSFTPSSSTFNCSDIGSNDVTLTVTDVNGNEKTCDATVTVIGSVAGLSLSENEQPLFCQGGAIELSSESDQSVAYNWSNGSTTEQTQVFASGTYTLTVTNSYGCTTSESISITYSQTDLLSAYTILVTDDAKIHQESEVTSGGVGSTDSKGKIEVKDDSKITASGTFAKADKVDVKNGSSVSNLYDDEEASVTLPDFKYNTYCKSSGLSDLKIKKNETVTITGSQYKKIHIESGAHVTFTSSDIYAEKIETQKEVTIEFSGCTRLYLCHDLKIGEDNVFNSDENGVVVYVEKKADINKGTTLHGSIYTLEDLDTKGDKKNHNYLTGMFIADKVHAHYTDFAWNTNCGPCSSLLDKVAAQENPDALRDADQDYVAAYPNPTRGLLAVRVNASYEGPLQIRVFNSTGQVMTTINQGDFTGMADVPVDLSDYASGMYFIHVTYGSKANTIKIQHIGN